MIYEEAVSLMEKMRFAGGKIHRDDNTKHDFKSVSLTIGNKVIEISVRVDKPQVWR
jgi:hypothetical protein